MCFVYSKNADLAESAWSTTHQGMSINANRFGGVMYFQVGGSIATTIPLPAGDANVTIATLPPEFRRPITIEAFTFWNWTHSVRLRFNTTGVVQLIEVRNISTGAVLTQLPAGGVSPRLFFSY